MKQEPSSCLTLGNLASHPLPPLLISTVREINEFPSTKCEGINIIHRHCPKLLHIHSLSWQGIGNYNNIYIDYKSPWVRQHKARERWTGAWHGCREGPANISNYKLPGLGGTWVQQGWLFLKATNPLSATTQTVPPPLSRYFSLFFPPTNFSVEFHTTLQRPGGCSFRDSIILSTVSGRSCLKEKEMSHTL